MGLLDTNHGSMGDLYNMVTLLMLNINFPLNYIAIDVDMSNCFSYFLLELLKDNGWGCAFQFLLLVIICS